MPLSGSAHFNGLEHNYTLLQLLTNVKYGAQWLGGRVRDSRPRGFEPHLPHCVVVLEQDTFMLA